MYLQKNYPQDIPSISNVTEIVMEFVSMHAEVRA
jgi:hypothetical protein